MWPDPFVPPLRQLSNRNFTWALLALSSTDYLTRYLSATFTPGNVFLGKTQEVGNFGQKNFRAAGCSVLHGFGKMQEALRVLQQGKWLMAVPACKASLIIFVLPKANRTQGKAGGQSTEQPALAQAADSRAGTLAQCEPSRAASSTSVPSHVLTRSFVYKRWDLAFAIPVPSSPGEGMRLPKKSLAWGRFAVIRNKHQPISSPAAKTTWSWHAGSFCPSRSPKKPAPG